VKFAQNDAALLQFETDEPTAVLFGKSNLFWKAHEKKAFLDAATRVVSAFSFHSCLPSFHISLMLTSETTTGRFIAASYLG